MIVEALLVSTTSGSTAYELKNLTTISKYKTPNLMRRNCVHMLNNDVFVLTDHTKPYLQVYQLNKSDEEQSCRMMLQAKSNVLSVTPDGTFIVIGLQNEVQLLHVASQQIYHCVKKHFQTITVIKCSPDGSMFATGADDGMVLLWHISRILQNAFDKSQQVYASFSDHVLAIKDIAFSNCSYKPLLVTLSNDRSLKVYDVNSKKLLLNVVFQSSPKTLVLNSLDTEIYVGNVRGEIHKLDLSLQPRSTNVFEDAATNLAKFSSCHTEAITCMAVNSSNKELVTGSLDKKLVVWNIATGRAIQTIEIRSPIFSIIVKRIPKSYFTTAPMTSDLIRVFRTSKRQDTEKPQEIAITNQRGKIVVTDVPCENIQSNNEEEVNELRKINDELFHYYRKLLDAPRS